MRIVHHVHDPEHVFFIGHDPRQPEHAPGRVVGMNGHPNVIFPAYRHDLLQKIPEIFKQPFLIHALVHGKQLLYPCHALRLPARQDRAVHILSNGGKHGLRVQPVHRLLGVGQHRRPIRAQPGQLRPGPVKHWHKVVAHQMNVLLAQIFQRLYIAADIHIPVCSPCFNGVMDIDALDPGNMEPGSLHLLFQRPDPLPAPHFSRLRIVKRRDDPGHAGDLADLL